MSVDDFYSDERQDTWYILAELFLDTELMQDDLQRIARSLAEKSYTIPQLQSIMRDEVAPALHTNLEVVAGAWGCWDKETEVVAPIVARLKKLNWRTDQGWSWIRNRVRDYMMINVASDWRKILCLVEDLR